MRAGCAGLIAVAVLLAGFPASASAQRPTRPCKDGSGARCGSLLVPLIRGAPDGGGRKLRIHFRVYPRTDRSRPALEPIVTVEGGPGYPSIDSAEGYLLMLGPLRRRHEMIVVDNRGTGRSGAINCPRLQAGKGVYAREVGRCARRLGRAANAYGTGAAADDLAAVLDRLRVPVVNVYGDSYGTYFSQAFAVRHRERVRAVVLDAAYAVEGFDPWVREESVAIRFAWEQVCRRSASCAVAAPLDELRRMSERLEARPLVGTGRDADGLPHRVRVDGSALGQIAGDASYYYSIYRDLLGRAARLPARRPRAVAAHRRGGPAVHGRRAGQELLRGRLRGRRLPRLPDDLGPLEPARGAAGAAAGGAGADRPGRLRAVREPGAGCARSTSTRPCAAASAGRSPLVPTRRCRRGRPIPTCPCSCSTVTST